MKHIVEQLYEFAVEVLRKPSLLKHKKKEQKILAKRIKEQIEVAEFMFKERIYKLKVLRVSFYIEHQLFMPPFLVVSIEIEAYDRLKEIRSKIKKHIRNMFKMVVWSNDEESYEKMLKNEFIRERVKVLLQGKPLSL